MLNQREEELKEGEEEPEKERAELKYLREALNGWETLNQREEELKGGEGEPEKERAELKYLREALNETGKC
ncbi:hypothetical protein [Alteribacillus sp. YIM 98480]|uniref:hypothetical protein n=1 Tax=Alteribacillus sp. YIM 98480 TaxID=2606599 RepID=UPI00131D780B|nr:hypothetical protein [Alteribacillus sp. YIM 98480]